MAKTVLKNATVLVNGVDISNHCSKATVQTSFSQVEFTSFGDNFKEYAQGIGDAQISLDLFQDFAASSIDATLWPLLQSGSVFPVVVKPTSATASATNPAYVMNSALFDYNPIDGQVGNASTTTVTFHCGDASGVTRATAGF